jgi:hypothetical protein
LSAGFVRDRTFHFVRNLLTVDFKGFDNLALSRSGFGERLNC